MDLMDSVDSMDKEPRVPDVQEGSAESRPQSQPEAALCLPVVHGVHKIRHQVLFAPVRVSP